MSIISFSIRNVYIWWTRKFKYCCFTSQVYKLYFFYRISLHLSEERKFLLSGYLGISDPYNSEILCSIYNELYLSLSITHTHTQTHTHMHMHTHPHSHTSFTQVHANMYQCMNKNGMDISTCSRLLLLLREACMTERKSKWEQRSK